MKALVIGGAGPTGPFIVNGLVARGYATTILHSGRHEPEALPPDIEHLHTDAFDPAKVEAALAGRTFDVAIVTYGRLRRNAEILAGRVGQFVSVGGFPGYRGYMNAPLFDPPGLPVPTREDAPMVREPAEDEKGYRIRLTEERVFEAQPEATHFRYPWIYGPRQPAPREWAIVRRILDRRPFLILPDGGLSLSHFGYVENVAHAVLLAIDQPKVAAGRIYNCGDQEVLSLAQVAQVIAAALGHRWELVSMPWAIAWPARPLVNQPWTTHRIVSLAKLEQELGYRDVVPPREALARTARWLVANPPAPGGMEELILQDPFDYAAEDALVARYRAAIASVQEPVWAKGEPPGYGLAYSGPGGRARSQAEFDG